MSDSPERNTEINLFFTRINIHVSYSLVIFSVGRQLDGQKTASCDIGALDADFLMSDPPVRNIKINLFLTRINVFVSYSLVISGVGRQHDGEKTAILRHSGLGKEKKVIGSYGRMRVGFTGHPWPRRE